jgi:hypothetical protein
MRLNTWAALAAALTLPLLQGCGDDNAQKGFVRVLNATSEYTSLDLYKLNNDGGNDLLVGGTAAGAASAYQGIDKGSYTFEVKGSTSAGAATPAPGTISKGDHFTVVTYFSGNSTKTQFLSDEENNPSSNNAKLRIFNAAPSEAPSVDVYLTANACNALAVTDTAFATAVTGLQTAYTQVTASAAGSTWKVCVFTAGDTSKLLLAIPALTLKNQEIATLILTHTSGGVLLNASVLDQQGAFTAYPGAISRVRVAADAAHGATVAVTLNGTQLTGSTASPAISDYVAIASGALTGNITIDSTTISNFTLPAAAAGTDYTLLVTGNAGSPVATLITDNNTPSTSTTQPVKARVINGVNNSTDAVSATIDNSSLGSPAVGAASTYVNLPATTGTSTVQATITTNPASQVNQTFAAGGVYTVFVWGDVDGPPKLGIKKDR